MKPSARRRGALALLALAGCGVAQNMGQWVGGEHCAGSHCGPSKEEKRLAREEAQRLEEARADAESERGGESIDLATVARKPAAFVLNLSGHHDHPACNGKYTYGGVANGKPQWVKEGGGGEKVFWTGYSWDCFWGGYSPEATVDTPVPPLAGYNKDRGGCDIKVRYQRVTDAGSANGRYPELAGEWRPTRQGQWTRPHQARDRRTVERWDADGRCQYQTEHDIGVVVVVSRMGDEYRCRGESGGARDAPQLIMRTNADGTHSWDLGAWGVEHWQRVTEPEEPAEGSGGSLRKVEVGRVMSWYDYRARAQQEGGRLPTTAELRAAGVDVGYDQWTPITPSPGDQETGRRDGARGKDENAWANIGPRKYQIEYPAWGLDASEHPWKRLTYFYVVVSASGGSGRRFSFANLFGWAGGGAGAASGGLREALDGAPRLKLVAAGSDDALHFDNAATLRAGGEAPLTANGKNVGLYWSQPRNAWGHWDYIDLGVSEKLRPLRVKLDGPFIVWYGPHGEFVFDVSMWQLHEGQHLVLVQACEGNPGGPTRMSQDAAGRDFVLYADGTIGPRTATHLRLGVVSKIGNLRPGWSAHEDIDMAYQGDVEIIHNWREEHSIEDLQRLVERKGYSAISVGSFDLDL